MDFARALELVGGHLDGEGVRWAVCGGLGLAAYGQVRTTFDADLVADGDAADRVIAFMERTGFETLYRSRGFSNHLHPDPGLGRVDFVWVHGTTREKLFDAARTLAGPGGRPIRAPRPEHLAAMKVAAMASDPARTFQDLADIRFLIDLPGIDREEIRGYFARHGLEARFDELEASR